VYTVIDASPLAEKIRIFGMMNNITQYVSGKYGTKSHFGMEMTIKNLPISGTVTHNDDVNQYNNTAHTIAIYGGGRYGSTGARGVYAHIYNTAAGLTIAYYDGTSTPKTALLGVKLGESFRLGFNNLAPDKIEILVNDKVIASDAKELANDASTMVGYVWVSSKRGSANGYSLDANKNGKIEDSEKISFTTTNFVFCNLNDVDVNTVASNTKMGGRKTDFILNATEVENKNITVDNAIGISGVAGNVGSMTKAYAAYDHTQKSIYLTLDKSNIDMFTIDVG
jgi:hypothetical protein